MFNDYRRAYIEMESDELVQCARDAIEESRSHLAILEAPYRDRLLQASKSITSFVIGEGKSITRDGVIATYNKGRTSTSWKSVAVAANAPQEVIDQFTKIGNPSVSVKMREVELFS